MTTPSTDCCKLFIRRQGELFIQKYPSPQPPAGRIVQVASPGEPSTEPRTHVCVRARGGFLLRRNKSTRGSDFAWLVLCPPRVIDRSRGVGGWRRSREEILGAYMLCNLIAAINVQGYQSWRARYHQGEAPVKTEHGVPRVVISRSITWLC